MCPTIKKLTIEKFRGIERFDWKPEPSLNVILGGGDVGKSTILEAIALLLSPTNNAIVSEADYWKRKVEDGFTIEAIISLPTEVGINHLNKHAWPWNWDGDNAVLPLAEGDPAAGPPPNPVYKVRVRGTSEFDVAFEIVQPDDSVDHFPATVRRAIGLVRLSGDDKNDRDLRLIQGSSLDRLLSDKGLRSRLQQKLASTDVASELSDEAKESLKELDETFKESALPDGLAIGLVSGQGGMSLNSLIGLLATKDAIQLPLSTWGSGTRRLAALEIAASHHSAEPITIIDEVERGLEPYMQRRLVKELLEQPTQTFMTTHSAAALGAAASSSIWYLDSKLSIGVLNEEVNFHIQNNPEAFLSNITIFCEGLTEIGFVECLLEQVFDNDFLSHGIWLVDGHGDDHTVKTLGALAKTGLKFAGFADDENKSVEKWREAKDFLGDLLFRWPAGTIEQNIVQHIPDDKLEAFISDPDDELTGQRLRSLADRLEIANSSFPAIKAAAGNNLKVLIGVAASGKVPEDKRDVEKEIRRVYQQHAKHWFKSVKGGRELAAKSMSLGDWAKIERELLPFMNAILARVSEPPVTSLIAPRPAAPRGAS